MLENWIVRCWDSECWCCFVFGENFAWEGGKLIITVGFGVWGLGRFNLILMDPPWDIHMSVSSRSLLYPVERDVLIVVHSVLPPPAPIWNSLRRRLSINPNPTPSTYIRTSSYMGDWKSHGIGKRVDIVMGL
jgi:hypothetical protein